MGYSCRQEHIDTLQFLTSLFTNASIDAVNLTIRAITLRNSVRSRSMMMHGLFSLSPTENMLQRLRYRSKIFRRLIVKNVRRFEESYRYLLLVAEHLVVFHC